MIAVSEKVSKGVKFAVGEKFQNLGSSDVFEIKNIDGDTDIQDVYYVVRKSKRSSVIGEGVGYLEMWAGLVKSGLIVKI